MRTALVTGATRGAGLAIATELGERGWEVVVTGRTTRAVAQPEGLPGSVEDAADAVTRAGGRGVGIRCDHTQEADVRALVAQIPRLDLVVNNAWGGYEHHDGAGFVAPFWEQDFEKRWRGMFEAGLRAHLLTAHHAAPLLVRAKRGLIVSTVAWDGGKPLGSAYYDIAKGALVRAAFALARDLKPHGVAALALAPGFMRTERVMAAHAAHPFDLAQTESPRYLARAVAALADDPGLMARTGTVQYVGELAEELGFTDEDGRQPPRFVLPE